MCNIKKLDQEKELSSPDNTSSSKKIGKSEGRRFSCDCSKKNIAGLIALVLAATMLIFAVLLASGIFGGGIKGFIAGGLAIGSMATLGAATILLTPEPPPTRTLGNADSLEIPD